MRKYSKKDITEIASKLAGHNVHIKKRNGLYHLERPSSGLLAKVALGVSAVPFILGAITPEIRAQEKTTQSSEDKENKTNLEVKIEEVAGTEDGQDLLRTTLSHNLFTLRYDSNGEEKDPDQWMFVYKALNWENTKLTLVTSGDVGDKHNDAAYDFGFVLRQGLKNLPLLGDSSLVLRNINSTKLEKSPHTVIDLELLSEKWDVGLGSRIKRDRDQYGNREKELRGFISYHNDDFSLSVGKAKESRLYTIFMLKGGDAFGGMAFGYFQPSNGDFNYDFRHLFGDVDQKGIFNQGIARLANDILILGTKDVNLPIFNSPLNWGNITHTLNLEKEGNEIEIMNKLGRKITNNFGLGGGVLVKRDAESLVWKVSPVLEVYWRIPLDGRTFYTEVLVKGKEVSFYSYMRLNFNFWD